MVTFVLLLFHFHIRCTNQKLNLPTSMIQENSTKTYRECLERVLAQSQAQHVHLVCGINTSYCLSTVASRTRARSWVIFSKNVSVRTFERRDLCVIAGDNVSSLHELLMSNHACHRGKIVLMIPSANASETPDLQRLFSSAWEAGLIDVVIVLSDLFCRVFTYVPIREHTRPKCPDLTPVLVSSWAEDSSLTNDINVTYFPNEKISSLHQCVIQVLIMRNVRTYWTPILHYLEAAMNATFNVTLTDAYPNILLKLRPSEIQVTPLLIHEILAVKVDLPAYLFYEENILTVPRVPASSSLWYGLLGELSDSVWYALILSLMMMIGVSYFLVKGEKDFGFVFFFRPATLTWYSEKWGLHVVAWQNLVHKLAHVLYHHPVRLHVQTSKRINSTDYDRCS